MANNFCPKCGTALVNGRCPSCGFSFNEAPPLQYYYRTRIIDCYLQMFHTRDILTCITVIAYIFIFLIHITYMIMMLAQGYYFLEYLIYILYVSVFMSGAYLIRYFRYGDRHPSNMFFAAASLVTAIIPVSNIILYGAYPSFFYICPVVIMLLFVSMRLEQERNIRGIFISGLVCAILWYFLSFVWEGILSSFRTLLIAYSYLVVSLAYVRDSQGYQPITPYYGAQYYNNNNNYNNYNNN